MSFINDILALSHVPRWGIVRTIRQQSVADHSYRVAFIAMEIADRSGIPVTTTLIQYALTHDVEESVTGDIPTIVKRRTREWVPIVEEPSYIRHGSLREVRIVKLADILEAHTWIRMNGIGSHANDVSQWLGRMLPDAAKLAEIPVEMVHRLGEEISVELGRMRTGNEG